MIGNSQPAAGVGGSASILAASRITAAADPSPGEPLPVAALEFAVPYAIATMLATCPGGLMLPLTGSLRNKVRRDTESGEGGSTLWPHTRFFNLPKATLF